MATVTPTKGHTTDERKDGIAFYSYTGAGAGDYVDVDTRGARKIYAVGPGVMKFRTYDLVSDDGTSYEIKEGGGCVNGTTAIAAHLEDPPARTYVHTVSAGNVYIQVIYERRRNRP